MKRDDVNAEGDDWLGVAQDWLASLPAQGVIAQLGQSLDGRIATPTGHSHYINAPSSRKFLHLLRAHADAVVVGVGTALADQPQLTTRHVDGPDPVRVVIDPHSRINMDNPLLNDDGVGVIHCHGQAHSPNERLAHVDYLPVPQRDTGIELSYLLTALGERGLQCVLVEGGRTTVSKFIEAQLVERLYLMMAPLLIGSGPSGIELPPIAHLDQAIRRTMRTTQCGDELLVEFSFRE